MIIIGVEKELLVNDIGWTNIRLSCNVLYRMLEIYDKITHVGVFYTNDWKYNFCGEASEEALIKVYDYVSVFWFL